MKKQQTADDSIELKKEIARLKDLNDRQRKCIDAAHKQIEELVTQKNKIGQVVQERDGAYYTLPVIRYNETSQGIQLIVGT